MDELSSAQKLTVVREFVPVLLAERDRLQSERDRLRSVVEELCDPPFQAFHLYSVSGDAESARLLEDWDERVIEARRTVQSLVP